jgi:hypothetical protein
MLGKGNEDAARRALQVVGAVALIHRPGLEACRLEEASPMKTQKCGLIGVPARHAHSAHLIAGDRLIVALCRGEVQPGSCS